MSDNDMSSNDNGSMGPGRFERDTRVRRQKALDEVYAYCVQPRTAEDVADYFGWESVQTARRHMWELEEKGRLKALVKRRDRKKLWLSVGEEGPTGKISIRTARGLVTLFEVADEGYDSNGSVLSNVIAGCLAYLWRRSHYAQAPEGDTIAQAQMGVVEPGQIRKVMGSVYGMSLTLTEVLADMLTELPELWKDESPSPERMIGNDLDILKMCNRAEWFEAWVLNKLEGR